MSELITTSTHTNTRFQLLVTVSALALFAATAPQTAMAEDSNRPTVWIELGGQLERMTNGREVFAPPFLGEFDPAVFEPVLPLQRPSRFSNGAEGKISFRPNDADWVFSASLRYGRSNGRKEASQRLPATKFPFHLITGELVEGYASPPLHLNAKTENTERHLVVDFQAGKDVGLGLFAGHGASLLSLGMRFAQFTSGNKTTIDGVPDFTVIGDDVKYGGVFKSHHRFAGNTDIESSFHGIGPSLSWDSSARILGRGDDSEVTFDWGINGAVLFGRQKVTGERNITGSHYKSMQYFPNFKYHPSKQAIQYSGVASSYHHPNRINRSRSVIVPNIGGFAGLSYRYSNAKLSLGYRADFFFGAMDGGIDTRKTTDRNFYGPFAAISVGLGG